MNSCYIKFVMNSRLKVSDFYKTVQTTSLINMPNIAKAFFLQDWLFVVSNQNSLELHQFHLISKQRTLVIQLPCQDLVGVQEIQGRICLSFNKKEQLWVYFNHKIVELQSHFAPITAIIKHQNQLLTGSVDMTIRRWKIDQKALIQDSKLHILTGHTNTINGFLSISDYFLSSSKDKSVFLWKNTHVKAKKIFQSSIISMISCKQSQQLAFLEESNKVWVLSQRILLQSNKLQTLRLLQSVTIEPIRQLNEVDCSFLQIVGDHQIQIAEINVGKVMAKVSITKGGIILASKCIRRLSLFAVKDQGVFMATF